MKTVRFKFSHNYYEDIEFDNDVTDEDIDAEFQQWLNEIGDWEVIEEDEDLEDETEED